MTQVFISWGRVAALFCLVNLAACGKVGNFFAEKCAGDNKNCLDPGLEMISAGGKTNLDGGEIGSGESTDALAPEDVVYQERTNITLTLTNPKLYPLRDFTVVFADPNSGFEILDSTDDEACVNVESLDYQESCTVTISYIFDGTTTPSETDVTFVFKTPKGQELSFTIPLSKPVILPDFSVSNTDAKYSVQYDDPSGEDNVSAPIHLVFDPVAYPGTGNYQGTLHVKNWGDADISDMSIVYTGDTEFTIDGTSTCVAGNTLAAGAECDVVLNFDPKSVGDFSGTLEFADGSGDIAHTYNILGSSDKITIPENDDSFDFGTTFAGLGSVNATITVTNPNPNMPASDCVFTAPVTAAYTVSENTCDDSDTLSSGSTCSFTVDWVPQAVVGTYADTATFACNLGGSIAVDFTMDVKEIPVLTWTPELGHTTDFGNVDFGGYEEITYTLTNTSADVALTNLVVSLESASNAGENEWSLASTTCSADLAALGTCEAVVRFTPTNAGAETVILRAGSDVEYTTVDANLSANGTMMELVLTPDAADDSLNSYEYSDREIDQAGSEIHTFTLKNNGNRNAIIAGTFDVGSSVLFSDAGTGTCAGLAANTLAAGDSCTYDLSFTADSAAGVDTATFTVTDSGGAAPVSDSVALSGETVVGPALDLVDDRGNTTPANIIASSDITGDPGDPNNIIDNNPTSRAATYTVRNVGNGPETPALENLAVTLTYVSGTDTTMEVTTDNCTGVSLALSETCTLIITYDPATTGVETSTYTLEITGDSVPTGVTYTATVTEIIGNSYEGANLEFTGTVPIDFGVKEITTASYLSDDVPLENQGATDATNVAYNFSVNPNTVFSKTSGSVPDCGSTISAGATCNFTVTFTHSNFVGAFLGTLDTSGDQAGDTNSVQIKAATAQALDVDTSALNQSDGNQGQVAVDNDRFYFVHKNTSAGSDPVLITCSRTATGGVNTAACSRLSLVTHFGLNAANNFGGDSSASGPRIVLTSSKILIGFQNKDTNTGALAEGNPTVVTCDKPGAGSNTVSTCAYEIVNSTNNTGRNVSLAVSNSKLVLASATATFALNISICDFDGTSAASSNTLTNCTSATTGGANQGTATNVAIDTTGSRILVASTDQSGADDVLRVTVCTYDFSSASGVNSYSACSASSADTVAGVDTGLYPSLTFSGTRVSIGHQKDLSNPEARLTGCTLGAGTNAISSCSSTDVTGASFEGFNTGIALGDNHLWMFAMTTGASGDYNRYSLQVWKCSLSTTSCDATPYYDSVTTKGHDFDPNPFNFERSEDNRRAYIPFFDATNNSLYVQYGSLTGGDWTMMNGLLQLGLTPEL